MKRMTPAPATKGDMQLQHGFMFACAQSWTNPGRGWQQSRTTLESTAEIGAAKPPVEKGERNDL